jgi:hypothetical protein
MMTVSLACGHGIDAATYGGQSILFQSHSGDVERGRVCRRLARFLNERQLAVVDERLKLRHRDGHVRELRDDQTRVVVNLLRYGDERVSGVTAEICDGFELHDTARS